MSRVWADDPATVTSLHTWPRRHFTFQGRRFVDVNPSPWVCRRGTFMDFQTEIKLNWRLVFKVLMNTKQFKLCNIRLFSRGYPRCGSIQQLYFSCINGGSFTRKIAICRQRAAALG